MTYNAMKMLGILIGTANVCLVKVRLKNNLGGASDIFSFTVFIVNNHRAYTREVELASI